MNETLFLEIFKIAKMMKKEIIVIQDNMILGTDELYNTVSVLYTEKDYNINFTIQFCFKELNIFLKNVVTFEILDKYIIGKNENDEKRILFYDDFKIFQINNLYKRCMNYKDCTKIICKNDNIKEDELFVDILSLKAADGLKMYKIDKSFVMSSFTGLHPINKTDKAEMLLYHIDELSFLAEFIITKKVCVIYEYIRYRYLN